MGRFLAFKFILVFSMINSGCGILNFDFDRKSKVGVDQGDDGSQSPGDPGDGQPGTQKALDILILIDNSSSMISEHRSMDQKMANFISQLKGVNYRLAVTTTDNRQKAWINGRYTDTPDGFGGKLVSFFGERNFVDGDSFRAEGKVIKALDRSSEAECFDEETQEREEIWDIGDQELPELCSTDRVEPLKVVESFLSSSSDFLRGSSEFVVLIITDEDIHDLENQDISASLARIRSIRPDFKAYGVVTEEADLSATRCQSNWSGKTSDGVRQLVNLSGGSFISICESDYGLVFNQIAEDFKN